jgi:hypothetical protein
MTSLTAVRSRHLRSAAIILLAASFQACSDSTAPGDEPPATLSEVLLEASDPLLPELSSWAAVGPVTISSISRFTPGGCSYDAGTQRFVCPASSSDGMTIERSFVLLDAAGSPQSRFDPATTASVQTRMHVFGTLVTSGSRFTMDDTDERTVSGLLTAPHVLDGSSSMTMSGTFASPGAPAETFEMKSSTKTEHLVLPSRSNRWPGPGTMTMLSTSSFADMAGGPITSLVKVTFTGTKCATIEVRFGDQVDTSTIDLSNPNAMSCKP